MGFLLNKKPTLSKSPGIAKSSGLVIMNDKLKGGNYSIITNPVKTRSGHIIDAADTQPISNSKTMKQAAETLAKTGNPVEKAAANYYLFMDDPTKRGSAKYYEDRLKKLGLDVNAKSNTGNPVGDFALDVVKGFVGSPAATGRVIAAGGMGATLLSKSKKSERGDIIKGGAVNAAKATVETAVETPGQFVGGLLAGAAGSKGLGLVSKAGTKTVKTTVKTSSGNKGKQTKPQTNSKIIDAEIHPRGNKRKTNSKTTTRKNKTNIQKKSGFLDASPVINLSLPSPKVSTTKGAGKRNSRLVTSRNTLKLTEGKSGGANTQLVPVTSNTLKFSRKSQKKSGSKTGSKTSKKTTSTGEKKQTAKSKQQNTQVPKFRRKSQTSAYKNEVDNFIKTLSDDDKYFLNNRAQMKIVDTPASAKKALTIRRRSLKNTEVAEKIGAKKGQASVSILKSNREAHKKFVAKLSETDLKYLQSRARIGIIDGTIKEADAALKKRHDAIRKHEAAQEMDAKRGQPSVSILKSNREAHKKFVAKLSEADLKYLQNRAKSGVVDGTIKDAEVALKKRHDAIRKHEAAQEMDAKRGQASVSILKSNREAHKRFVAKLSEADLKYLQNRAKSGVVDGTIKDAEAALKERHAALRKHKAAQEMDAKRGRPSVSILKSNREAHKRFVAKLSEADLKYLQNRAKSGVVDGTIKDAEAALEKRHAALRKHEAAKSYSNALILPSQLRIIKEPTPSKRRTSVGSYVEVDAGNGMKYLMRVDSKTKQKSGSKTQQKPVSKSKQVTKSKQETKSKAVAKTKRGSSRARRVTALKSGSASSTNTQLSSRQKQTTALSRQQKTEIEKALSPGQSSKSLSSIALTLSPALAHSQKRKSSTSAKPAQSGKLIHSSENKTQTKPKTDTETKKDSEQKRKQAQTQKRASRQKQRSAALSAQRSRQARKSKQVTKSTPKSKTKSKSRIRLEEEKKKKQRKKITEMEKGAFRFETVNTFGWIKDKKPAAKPRRIR